MEAMTAECDRDLTPQPASKAPLSGITVLGLEQAIADIGTGLYAYSSVLAARGRWRQVDSPVGPVPALLPPALALGWTAVNGRVPALGADTDAIRAEVSQPR